MDTLFVCAEDYFGKDEETRTRWCCTQMRTRLCLRDLADAKAVWAVATYWWVQANDARLVTKGEHTHREWPGPHQARSFERIIRAVEPYAKGEKPIGGGRAAQNTEGVNDAD